MDIKIQHGISTLDYLNLHKDAGWLEIKKSNIKKAIKNSMVVISILHEDKVVGMGRLIGDWAIKGLLCDIIVLKAYQNKGIGSLIINEIIKATKKIIKEDLFMIECLPTANNRDFYIKNGFKYNPNNMDGVYLWLNKM